MIKHLLGATAAATVLFTTATAAHADGPDPGRAAAARSAGADRAADGDGWRRIGDGITSGISGLAVDGRHGRTVRAVAVRDNKKPGENRLVTVDWRRGGEPRVRPLGWPGEQPVDLEAVDAVPGRAHEYVALTSDGDAYRFRLAGHTVRVLGTFAVPHPPEDAEYEGFALHARGGNVTAVWADRGQDEEPALLTAARWDPRTNAFGATRSAEFRAPYPDTDVRHVSDLKVSPAGALVVSSASDPGDDGPFTSALYDIGELRTDKTGAPRLGLSDAPRRLAGFAGRKIEALACLPGSRAGLLGSDDENGGGSLRTAAFCPR